MSALARSLGLGLVLLGCGGGSAPAPAEPAPRPPLGEADNAFIAGLQEQLGGLWNPEAGTPEALLCVRFDATGRVTRGSLKASTGSPATDARYAQLVDKLRAARNAAPEPPPPGLAARLVEDPVCVKPVVTP